MYKLMILIFFGSVFITSEIFVDKENTAKYFLTILTTLLIMFFLFFKKNVGFKVNNCIKLITLKGFFWTGLLLSIQGILQNYGILSSIHSKFHVTGSFENPAGFAVIVSLTFPIGFVWFLQSKQLKKITLLLSLCSLLFSLVLSGSRTGLLAITVSTFSILIIKFQLISRIKDSKKNKLLAIILSIVFLVSILGLYKLKPDSADGRLLIWQVSFDMIKDKPFFGFGYNGFKGNYMEYQANYFKENPTSRFRQLADNISHPFNEFIKLTVNFGIIGLLVYLLFLFFLVKKIFILYTLLNNLNLYTA